ncbi:MAG: MMPL family transporter [Planctomycetota bacterium]|nr:MMPL family transporter [Planctomycetota bacterium]
MNDRSRTPRWVDPLARLIVGAALPVVVVAILLAVAGGVLAANRLHLDADTNHLIAEDRPFMEPFLGWLDEFGDLEYLFVVVDPKGDDAAADAAVRELVPRLREVPGVPEVHGWVSVEEQWRLAPRGMPAEDLSELVAGGEALALLASEADAGLVLDRGLDHLDRLSGFGAISLSDDERRSLGTNGILLVESIAASTVPGIDDLAAPGPDSLGSPRTEEFLVNPDGSLRFIEVLPRKDFGRLDAIAEPLAQIRRVMRDVESRHPTIEIGITGKPVLQADELATSDADMTRCATGAFLVIAVMFTWVFRGVRRPLLIVLAFACAFGWTYGAATLLVGRLNLLSIVFMLVLVGVGLDYGVHVVSRWIAARRTLDVEASVRDVLATAGVGNLYGAATSAGVFLLGLATDFGGLRELGLIAGTGLLLCMVAMVVVLPALLVLLDRRVPPPLEADDDSSPAVRSQPGRTGLVVVIIATIVSSGLGWIAVKFDRFEENLLELQAVGLESVEWEHRVLADSTSASWFAASIVDSIAEVERVTEAAEASTEVGAVRSVLDLVQRPSAERDRDRAALAAAVDADPGDLAPGTPIDARRLRTAAGRVRSLAGLARDIDPGAADRLAGIEARLTALARGLDESPASADAVTVAIDAARRRARAAVLAMRDGATTGLREALPGAVRARLVAPSGRFMVSLVPANDVWSPEPMARFVTAIRAIDPDVTGVPITQYESLRDMRRAFLTMAILSTGLVLVLVAIDFRRVRPVLVAMTSLAVGLLWTIGVASALGVHLNVANFFAVPILIGIGIDSAIHMLHRADECGDGPLDFRGTRGAVIVTALTTGIGFGSLVFAQHRGLESLGLVMAIGSACCLLSTIVLLPTLTSVGRSRPGRGPTPNAR